MGAPTPPATSTVTVFNRHSRTRSWEEAERFAQHERYRRDQDKRKLREIEEQEVQKLSLRKEKNITVKAAADR